MRAVKTGLVDLRGLDEVRHSHKLERQLAMRVDDASYRWMAPELIFAMAEDDPKCFELTTWSDVYAFASVCLEVSLDVS